MNTNLNLVFPGTCSEAFAFYEQTFATKVSFQMKYADAPPGSPTMPQMNDKIMHISMPLGSITLMGCDAPMHMLGAPASGWFQVAVTSPDEAEVTRIYNALSEGGSVQMPLGPTFWAPRFGMCTDKFGIAWMVSVPGPQM